MYWKCIRVEIMKVIAYFNNPWEDWFFYSTADHYFWVDHLTVWYFFVPKPTSISIYSWRIVKYDDIIII